MNNILEIKNLSKKYQNSNFELKDVSFSVPYGTIVGFVGENGAGKTTTINAILNTIHKDNGTIKIFDQELTQQSSELLDDIGVVFDAVNFSGFLTPLKLSKVMNGVYKKWDNQKFNEYLKLFSLPTDKKIREFSKGMSMKLAIAVANSHSPKLLILDEATSGLDPVSRDEILDIFLDFVCDETHSIFLSSHITSDLERIADYLIFIHNGKIILTAKKDDLIYNYGIMRATTEQFSMLEKEDILAYRKKEFQTDVLVSDKHIAKRKYKDCVIDNISIDEIMVLFVKGVN